MDNQNIVEPSICPACGCNIEPGTYRCPKCHVYFCYRCRIQLHKTDLQYICANRTCNCHGKLHCASCSPPKIVESSNTRLEYIEGWWKTLLILTLLVATITYFLSKSFAVTTVFAFAVFDIIFYVITSKGGCIFTEIKTVQGIDAIEVRSCIECKHPVKMVAGSLWNMIEDISSRL